MKSRTAWSRSVGSGDVFRGRLRGLGRLALCGLALAGLASACTQDAFTPPFVFNVRVVPDSVYLAPGESIKLHIRVFSQMGDSFPDRAERVEVYSEDPSVARVDARDPDATIVAVGLGKTRIVATLGYGADVAKIFVVAGGGEAATAPPTPSAADPPPSRPGPWRRTPGAPRRPGAGGRRR